MRSIITSIKTNLIIRIFLTNIFALLFLLLSFFIVVKPAIGNIMELKKKYSKYIELSQKLNSKIDRITQYNLLVNENDYKLQILNFIFPYDYNYSYLLTILENLAQKTGVKLLSISYSKGINDKLARNFRKEGITLLEPVTFSVTFEGSLRQMAEYIKMLEQTPFRVQIVSLSYSQENEQNNRQETYSITFVVFKTSRVISLKDMYDF